MGFSSALSCLSLKIYLFLVYTSNKLHNQSTDKKTKHVRLRVKNYSVMRKKLKLKLLFYADDLVLLLSNLSLSIPAAISVL